MLSANQRRLWLDLVLRVAAEEKIKKKRKSVEPVDTFGKAKESDVEEELEWRKKKNKSIYTRRTVLDEVRASKTRG